MAEPASAEPAAKRPRGAPTAADLVAAAERGDADEVSELLMNGALWNAEVDGVTAGEAAKKKQNRAAYEVLVQAGVRTQMVLQALEAQDEDERAREHETYLKMPLEYKSSAGQEVLQSQDGNGVMMGWEAPLMKLHAKELCAQWTESRQADFHVLNIGFGLGLIDSYLQDLGVPQHSICEAHPDVLAKLERDGWHAKPGVRVLAGKWQDTLKGDLKFDAIYYDAFSEYYEDMQELHERLPQLLKPGGVYSYFNGLCADTNPFFHEVAYRRCEVELEGLGFELSYTEVPMSLTGKEWDGIRKAYWILDTYNLPRARFVGGAEAAAEETEAAEAAEPGA